MTSADNAPRTLIWQIFLGEKGETRKSGRVCN